MLKLPKKLLLLFILISYLGFNSSGCTSYNKEKKLKRFTIAFQTWVGYGLVYLAEEKGFFKEEGIEPLLVYEELDSSRREAFRAGLLDFELGTVDQAVAKRIYGVDVTIVCGIDYSFGSDGIAAVKEITSLKDLAGRKLALSKNDVGEIFLLYLLRKSGIPPDSLSIISCSPEKVAQSFIDKEVDAVVTWEPWLSEALKRPDSRLLITSKEAPGIIIDVLNVRSDIVRDDPELVKSFMRAWFNALKYYSGNPEESAGIIAKYYNVTPSEYKKNVEGLKWMSYGEQINPQAYKKMVDVINFVNGIKSGEAPKGNGLPVQGAINRRLLEELYENLD